MSKAEGEGEIFQCDQMMQVSDFAGRKRFASGQLEFAKRRGEVRSGGEEGEREKLRAVGEVQLAQSRQVRQLEGQQLEGLQPEAQRQAKALVQ